MILTSIRNFIRNQKLLFAVFIILQILAVVSIQYAYLGNVQKENNWIIYIEEATLFRVGFSEEIKISQLNDIIYKIKDKYGEKLTAISIDIDDGNLRAYYFGQNKVVNYGKTDISSDDVIVSTIADVSNCKQLGDIFETTTKNFNVAALRTDVPYNEILLESVTDEFNIKTINITLSFLPTVSQRMEFTEYLQGIFPSGNIVEPKTRSLTNEAKFSSELISVVVLLILTIINIIFIFRYVITKRKKYYTISRLCGATKAQIFVATLSEYFVYCFTSCLIATFITKTIVVPVFYTGTFFTWNVIVLPVVVFMAMCICIILPLLVKNSNLHMIQSRMVK